MVILRPIINLANICIFLCFCFCFCFSGQRGTIAVKLGFTYEKHLCVALTGSEQVAQTHPLASYFLV